jgi:amine acid ABC transporter, permease protein, 3-TM region, His/Glu/Gln/Arg/opine family
MDFDFIKEQIPLYIEGAKLTLTIGSLGIILSIIIGMLCSITTYFKIPILGKLVSAYIELARNTPLLIQLYFLYFGLPKVGIVLSATSCAIIGLTFLGGSYMAEVLRSGLESIEKIQIETALSLGMKRIQVFFNIILSQAISNSIPAFCANIIFLIKETSVLSIVALADLMFVTKELIGIYYKTDEALFMLVISYLMILLPISIGCTFLERRVRYAEYGD